MSEKQKDSFFEWLNKCPVDWLKLEEAEEYIDYRFFMQDEENQDEDE